MLSARARASATARFVDLADVARERDVWGWWLVAGTFWGRREAIGAQIMCAVYVLLGASVSSAFPEKIGIRIGAVELARATLIAGQKGRRLKAEFGRGMVVSGLAFVGLHIGRRAAIQ